MRKTLFRILPLLALALLAAGCGKYSKLMKNGTPQQKYEAGVKYLNEGKNQRAVDIFEEIRPMFIGLPQEDSIMFFTGMGYYRQRSYESSTMIFDEFRKTFGRSPFLEDAEFLYADGLYRSSAPVNRDQTATISALIAISEYLSRYPRSKHKETMLEQMEELQLKLREKAYINAKVYYNIAEYKAAVVAFRNALDEYPDNEHREEMMYLIVKSNYLLANNSLERLQRERYMDVQEAYYNFAGEYPESKYMKEVNKMNDDARARLAKFSEKQETETDK